MKYFKYAQIDNTTNISTMIEPPKNSPTHPNIPGLDIIWMRNDWWFATADDTATPNPDNFIFELTSNQWVTEIQNELNIKKTNLINQINDYQKNIRSSVTQDYHYTELIAGLVKVPEANAALAATTDADADSIAPSLHTEATLRGVTTKQLAQKVIDISDNLMAIDTNISGIAGKKIDEINAIIFNPNDPTACIKEFNVYIQASINPNHPSLMQRIPKYNSNYGWPTIYAI